MKFLEADSIKRFELIEHVFDETTVLMNFSEPISLYPYYTFDRESNLNGFHVYGDRSILYHLYIFFNKGYDIIYVTPDINISNNIKLVQEKLNVKDTDIKIVLFPWYFLFEYFSNPLGNNSYSLKESVNLPIEYSAIFLSGGRRFCRIHIISELSAYDNFIFSNPGYSSTPNSEYKVYDYELGDNIHTLNVLNIKDGHKLKIDMTNDSSIETFLIRKNGFVSNESIYFKPDLTKYKSTLRDETLPWCQYNIVPDEYLKSAISLGCETQTDLACNITEKTIKNFFYKKPFLNFGAKHYYKFLTSHGFELHDELFDYSFDNIDSNGIRLKKYLQECKKILEMDLKDLINVIDKDKLDYNYSVCEKIDNKYSASWKKEISVGDLWVSTSFKNRIMSNDYDDVILKKIV